MKFDQLPLQQNFYLNDKLHYKICPIFSSCCTVQYNASNKDDYVLIDRDVEIIPADKSVAHIQPIVFSTSNLFTQGDIMFLRKVPMNTTKFIVGGQIYKRVGADRVQKENGEVVQMSKNTLCEIVESIDENIEESIEKDTDKEYGIDADEIDDDEIYNGN